MTVNPPGWLPDELHLCARPGCARPIRVTNLGVGACCANHLPITATPDRVGLLQRILGR